VLSRQRDDLLTLPGRQAPPDVPRRQGQTERSGATREESADGHAPILSQASVAVFRRVIGLVTVAAVILAVLLAMTTVFVIVPVI